MKREELDQISDARLLNALRRWLSADETTSFADSAISTLLAAIEREPEPEPE